jgi:hypothetical protein
MTIHEEQHPLANQMVYLDSPTPQLDGATFHIEDWWDRVAGVSWMFANNNPAAMKFGIRSGFAHLPVDNEVVYGKIDGMGEIVHVSELANVKVSE